MRKITSGAFLVLFLLPACGGETPEPVAPPPPPPPPVSAEPPPTPPPPVETAAPEPPKPTMEELQKKWSQAFIAAFNAHDAKKVADLYAADAVSHEYGMPEMKGREAIEKSFAPYFAGFPDVKCAFTRIWLKGDTSIAEWVAVGTNDGDFMGHKATKKKAGLQGLSISVFTPEGLVKEDWVYMNHTDLAVQTGAQKGEARPVPTLPAGEPQVFKPKGTPEEDKLGDYVKTMSATFEKKSVDDFLKTVADDAVWSDMSQKEDMKGKDAAKKWFQGFTKAFPDGKMNTQNTWAFGDTVIVQSTFTGTQNGPLGPIKATKKPVSLHGVDVIQVKDGKAVRGWSYMSSLELLDQLGLLPKPKAEAPKGEPKKAEPAKKPEAPKGEPAKKPEPKPAPKK